MGTCHDVVDCSGTSNPKVYFDLLLFHLAHGKTRPQKTPKIHKKAYNQQKKCYLTFLKVLPETKCFLYFFKAKNIEKNSIKYFVYYFLVQKPFSPFFKNKKNTKQPLILNSIFGNWSLM